MLAIDGGGKVRETPFPKRGLFTGEEKQAVARLFDSAIASGTAFGYGGPEEQGYEQEFADYLGGGYADLVNSGTSALYVALGGLELEPAGEVIVPAISDFGGVMPAAMLNQVPVVADACPGSYNVGPDQVEAVVSSLTRAIVVPHISGEPADLDPILEIASQRDIPLIEDCAQSHGATYKGRPVGTVGTVGVFSTMSGKHHATAAQGGVAFTTDQDLYWRIKRFADRGKPFNTDAGSNVRAGLNLNGNDLAAAVGRVQLRKLPGITQRRQVAAEAIREDIVRLKSVSPMHRASGAMSAYWFMPIHVDTDKLTVDKDQFARAVAAEGVPLSVTYGRVIAHAGWFTGRKVFGTSDYPWGLPEYEGDRDAEFPCPNAVEAMASHFVIRLHEAWGPQEAADAVAAIAKVEKAYLR